MDARIEYTRLLEMPGCRLPLRHPRQPFDALASFPLLGPTDGQTDPHARLAVHFDVAGVALRDFLQGTQ